jgi:hypothetical protein
MPRLEFQVVGNVSRLKALEFSKSLLLENNKIPIPTQAISAITAITHGSTGEGGFKIPNSVPQF